MIISCACDPHYGLQILNLMNTKINQMTKSINPLPQKTKKMKFVAFKIFI